MECQHVDEMPLAIQVVVDHFKYDSYNAHSLVLSSMLPLYPRYHYLTRSQNIHTLLYTSSLVQSRTITVLQL